ncbi:hypothetical protein CISG_00450 [Coccidioides immitis RMSCC 3703]|uniref:Uncharacterized protein n=1 Tax=Coccidioides immitis RMSCC 3703 TaxID=454286 RepID=A0A0J8QI67_COCIT|nr:hypothetical protein CISG_00450 [Coccidioides immitis RMSCC 3703]
MRNADRFALSHLSTRTVEPAVPVLVLSSRTWFTIFFPEDGKPASIAPSLQQVKRGIGTEGANGVNGAHSKQWPIPSYYRCTIPPLDKVTGFFEFYESEAGYEEVRRFFDYLRAVQMIGPHLASGKNAANGSAVTNGNHGASGSNAHEGVEICVVDADDLLDNPAGVIERFCISVGEEFTPDMLNWESKEDQATAKEAFEKWPGFHEDAMHSTSLKPRLHKKKLKTEEEFDCEWRDKYGEKGAKIIRSAVNRSMSDYLYMKQFAMKV